LKGKIKDEKEKKMKKIEAQSDTKLQQINEERKNNITINYYDNKRGDQRQISKDLKPPRHRLALSRAQDHHRRQASASKTNAALPELDSQGKTEIRAAIKRGPTMRYSTARSRRCRGGLHFNFSSNKSKKKQ
jgi:hypothetical protein